MDFIGRERELSLLSKLLQTDGMQVSLIYGRAGVGKRSLIKEALKSISYKSVYYVAKETSELNNLESLSILISELLDFPTFDFDSLEKLLEFIFERAITEQIVLVIDEYPCLRKAIKGFDSIMQVLIDRYKETSKLKIILCGSRIETMEDLLNYSNPLYGRFDRIIHLLPMDYYDSSLFYEKFSFADRVRLYSVFGGIPFYKQFIDPNLGVKENIINLIASPRAQLQNEIFLELRSENSKMTNINEVLEALARGISKFNDLLHQSHVSSSPTLVDVLEKLIKMELVHKISPINDPHNKRKTRYYIFDPLFLFFYRYLFPYTSQLNVMDPKVFYERYIAQDFESYFVPKALEDISRQYLIRKNIRGENNPIFDLIGKYCYDDVQSKVHRELNLVTLDQKGYIFYETNFKAPKITQSMIDQVICQVKNTGLDCYRYGFIARDDYEIETMQNEKLILLTLKDLYL